MTDVAEKPVESMTVPELKAALKERDVATGGKNKHELVEMYRGLTEEDESGDPQPDEPETVDGDAVEVEVPPTPEEAEREHEASTAIAVREPQPLQRQQFDDRERELISRLVAPGHTADELALFERICIRTGLDPFARQIYSIKRNRRRQVNGQWISEEVATPQTSIDGFRLIAHRTGRYAGQTPPMWCGMDGEWTDVWLKDESPAAARVGVFRVGFAIPLTRTVTWKEFGATTATWKSMPALMLAKVAESQALRAAFPQELSGLYTEEEMAQSRSGEPDASVAYEAIGNTPIKVDAPQTVPPRSWAEVMDRLRVFGSDDDMGWPDWIDQASLHLYGKTAKDLDPEVRKTPFFQKVQRFVVLLDDTHDPHHLPPLSGAEVAALWAQVLDGAVLDLENPLTPEEDIPFGNESVGEAQDALTAERGGFDTTKEGGATP